MPLMTIVDKTEHTRRRQFSSLTRGFTITAIKGYEGLVKNRSVQLIDTSESKNLKETQSLTEWFAFFFAYDNNDGFGVRFLAIIFLCVI